MKAPVWEERFSVGIPEIDADHRRLIEMMSDLFVMSVIDRNLEETQILLDRLIDATLAHFAHEEGLMRRWAYPNFEQHRAEHRILITEIETLRDEWSKRLDVESAMAVLRFLRDWLIGHIEAEDRKLARLSQAMPGTVPVP